MRKIDSPREGATGSPRRIPVLHSIRVRLLILMLALSLLPLGGMSLITYSAGRSAIQERIRVSLGKMAQDAADKIDLMLRGKREEIHSMAVSYALLAQDGRRADANGLTALLDEYAFNHEGYDLLLVTDVSGRILGVNTTDRDLAAFAEERVDAVVGADISDWGREGDLFLASAGGRSSHANWYRSELVRQLYGGRRTDVGAHYNLALSEPIRNPGTNQVVGVWLSILNGTWLQGVLDNAETDMDEMDLGTGRAFLAFDGGEAAIGRRGAVGGVLAPVDEWRVTEALGDAIARGDATCDYASPADGGAEGGVARMAGLAPVSDKSFGWWVGMEIDESDVLRPVDELGRWLLGVNVLLALAVVASTWLLARGITRPLKVLTRSAQAITQGDFTERAPMRSKDELGLLASAFNEMAGALSTRETQLQEMARNLEAMVKDRTLELENSHEALKRAYLDLQSTQDQLVQTEKMASLGQLVSGIAHEIKNPLNFIYGNTDFLRDYTQKLQGLVEKLEALPGISDGARQVIEREKAAIGYDFIKEDLKTLIDNFTEGAERINAIVTDLRAFSRMDADVAADVDLRALLEMSLNLLRNQYKDRVAVHRDFGDIPKVRGYAGKLNQVFMNLLSNAFYAVADKGDVWLRTRFDAPDAVVVQIEDNGAGIPEGNLKRIFEPFFTTKPVGQGTGLGLSISYGIIEQHRGGIQVASSPGEGTVFTVRLPACPGARDGGDGGAGKGPDAGGTVFQNRGGGE
ncbi:MAG: HAMP domain-containing protein [Acidobacteriota bacterium]|nr:HAMP domain-containing protein [Acidobacteriota bacterium]